MWQATTVAPPAHCTTHSQKWQPKHMRTFGCDTQPTATQQWPRYQRSSDIVWQAFLATATYSSVHRQNHTANYNTGTLAPVSVASFDQISTFRYDTFRSYHTIVSYDRQIRSYNTIETMSTN